MQNKHYFFFSFLGIPTFGEGGGGQAGWAKIPTFTENLFCMLPLSTMMIIMLLVLVIEKLVVLSIVLVVVLDIGSVGVDRVPTLLGWDGEPD